MFVCAYVHSYTNCYECFHVNTKSGFMVEFHDEVAKIATITRDAKIAG